MSQTVVVQLPYGDAHPMDPVLLSRQHGHSPKRYVERNLIHLLPESDQNGMHARTDVHMERTLTLWSPLTV
jgi:hypothetical protein